jgi:hypothetical protein
MNLSASPTVQIQLESRLVDINQAGIAELANGTRWRIAVWDLSRARKWPVGATVTLAPNDPGKAWAFKLTNADSSEQVAVGRAARKPLNERRGHAKRNP